MEKQNIYQKMAAITNDLKTVAKNLDIGVGKSSYKAVSEKDVLDAVKPLENKYGIYSYAFDRQVIESGEIVATKIDFQTKQKYDAKQLWLRIETTYRFVNVDNPDEYIDIKTYGDGIDNGDKATGKAMTYADKYALLKAYKISTGDDPDKEESGELKTFKTKKEVDSTAKKETTSNEHYNRDKLMNYIQKNNLDMNQIARKYKLNGKMDEQRYAEVLKEMGIE